MGQDIPGKTEASDLTGAEFNSPFEEFSLLLELRNTRFESPGIRTPNLRLWRDRDGRKRKRFDYGNTSSMLSPSICRGHAVRRRSK